MKQINGDQNPLDLLDGVSRVEAPPFLMTRIQERIKSNQASTLNVYWALLMTSGLVVLLVANVWLITFGIDTLELAPQLIEGMQLHSSDELYPTL